MIGAVILAAGRSQRMGSSKLVLRWGDTTVVGRVANVLKDAGVEDVVVVTGGDQDGVENALRDLPVRTIFNPEFANGEMLLTLQCGLVAFKDEVEAALVVLGDQPQIELAVVQSVIGAYMEGNYQLIVPSYQKRRGHPWLVARPLWGTLLNLRPPATMRTFLNQQAADLQYVAVNTASILQDIDTPEDYQRFLP